MIRRLCGTAALVALLTLGALVGIVSKAQGAGDAPILYVGPSSNSTAGTIDAANPDGSGAHVLFTLPYPSFNGIAYPVSSPDGSQIAFSMEYGFSQETDELFLVNADGTNLRRLTNNSATDSFPSFSPDGSKLVFSSSRNYPNSPGQFDVFTMNLDGSGVQLVTPNGLLAKWSPDGVHLAFFDGLGISTVSMDGSGRVQVFHPCTGYALRPAWSPDGRKIAFTYGDPAGNRQLFVMNANGTDVHVLTPNPGYADDAAWSPDGTKILYTRGYYSLMVMNADGSDQHSLGLDRTYMGDWARNAPVTTPSPVAMSSVQACFDTSHATPPPPSSGTATTPTSTDSGSTSSTPTTTGTSGAPTPTPKPAPKPSVATLVTGGGWLVPTLQDKLPGIDGKAKATFGLSARSVTGATGRPSGNFELRYGKLHLKSTLVDAVSFDGGLARVTGYLRIDGQSGVFRFSLEARDAQPDRLSVSVFRAGSAPLYRVAQNLGGGSIVVH